MKVLRALLDKVLEVDVDDEAGYARATHAPVEGLESEDTVEELFRRRMGLRNYLKLLKMSRVSIRNAKVAKEDARRIAATAGATASMTTGEVTPKQATAALAVAIKTENSASVTNPPSKAVGKKKVGAAKKKATKKKVPKK